MLHAASVEFLGYILEKGRVRADPKKVRAVEEWERPTNRSQLWRCQFLLALYPRVQPGRCTTLRTQLHPPPLLLVPGGRGRLHVPQTTLHLSSGAHLPQSRPPVYRGSGCVGCEHRCCSVSMLRGGPTHPPGHLPVLTLHSGGV